MTTIAILLTAAVLALAPPEDRQPTGTEVTLEAFVKAYYAADCGYVERFLLAHWHPKSVDRHRETIRRWSWQAHEARVLRMDFMFADPETGIVTANVWIDKGGRTYLRAFIFTILDGAIVQMIPSDEVPERYP